MTTQKNHPAAGQPDSFDRYPGYYGSDLELTYTPQRSVFTLWAPTADKVRLNLYASGEGGEPEERLEMRPSDDGTWRVAAERDLKGTFYTFQIEKEGKWLDETPGIWAKAVGVNGGRADVIDLRETDPEGWEADRAPELKMYSDIILYELHHRDFSVAPDSGIENKGKFLALTETGTKTPQGEASGLDHLKELGVTHIHILPSFDYATVDEARLNDKTYNWGYDPKNYNVPEGSYSTDPADPAARIREFKQMVQSLHRNGMRIVLDVVYNHTSPDSVLYREHPEYFYRGPDGKPGNKLGDWADVIDLDYSNRGLWQYLTDTLVMWAKLVDGFRCDVASFVPVEFWLQARAAVADVNPDCVWLAETVHRSYGCLARRHGVYSASDGEVFRAFDLEYEYDVREVFDRYLRGKVPLSRYLDALNFQETCYPANYNKLRFLENHDQPRIASFVRDERALVNDTAMLYFLKGTTLLYAGQEFVNDHLPSLFDLDPIDRRTGRDLSGLLRRLYAVKQQLGSADWFFADADDANDLALLQRGSAGKRFVGVFSLKAKAADVRVDAADGVYVLPVNVAL